jgi:hypothetical protein
MEILYELKQVFPRRRKKHIDARMRGSIIKGRDIVQFNYSK